MAKGIRSKYKRRIRSVRRDHYYEIEGKQKLQDISTKLHDPTYDFTKDGSLPVNAFVEPNNPLAVFPQHAKPHILDFRSHKMAASGFASIGNFRKIMSTRAKQSKYQTIVKTTAELEAEEDMLAQLRREEMMKIDDNEIDIDQVKKSYTVDDITEKLSKKMKISKAKKSEDVPMDLTKTINKVNPKGSKIAELKKKGKNKTSRAKLMF